MKSKTDKKIIEAKRLLEEAGFNITCNIQSVVKTFRVDPVIYSEFRQLTIKMNTSQTKALNDALRDWIAKMIKQ